MNSSDNFQDSALSRLMPLMNSSFTPGQAQATVDNFQDLDQRQIAQAELYYFSGRAEECRNIAELYLQDKDLCLRLSAALYILFPILLLEIHLPPEWDSEISRNVFLLQKTVLHQKESWLPVFSPTIWPWY